MRVLVVEDNPRLGSLIAKLLHDDGHTVDLATNLEEARAALALAQHEVVLLDLTLPDGDGRDVFDLIRQGGGNALVLVVTARGDIVDRVQALNSGADDYIVKPFSDDELIARVRALGRRARPIRESVLSAGNVSLDTESMTLAIAGRPVAISRRELLVLSALLAQQGKVLPREKLDNAVYALDSPVTNNAVEAAVSRLRKHLDAAGATVKVTAMRGIGYILTESPPC
jgi:DNA-binding response OmpR family regulator